MLDPVRQFAITPKPIGNFLLAVLEMLAPESGERCGHRHFKIALKRAISLGGSSAACSKIFKGTAEATAGTKAAERKVRAIGAAIRFMGKHLRWNLERPRILRVTEIPHCRLSRSQPNVAAAARIGLASQGPLWVNDGRTRRERSESVLAPSSDVRSDKPVRPRSAKYRHPAIRSRGQN
jgi:hypothetical protein